MDHVRQFLEELDAYASERGVDANTVCRNATGNPRLRERMESRAEKLDEYITAIKKYMDHNPPKSGSASLSEAS